MKQIQHGLEQSFVNPSDHRKLSYKGGADERGRWTDGVLVTEEGDVLYPVEEGIPRFLGSDVSGWDDPEFVEREFLKGRDPQFYFEHAYDYMVHQWPEHDAYLDWLQKIAATDGPILELAVGPGGGASMMVLDLNPNAHYIMNELGLWLLKQWRKFARGMSVGSGEEGPTINGGSPEESDTRALTNKFVSGTREEPLAINGWPSERWPNLGFAQFDATQMPIASDSLAAVVSMGGISNIGESAEEGKHGRHLALQEAYRVLRPGGWLYAVEVLPDHELTDKCPPEMVAKLKGMFPEMKRGFRPLLEGIGFDPVRIRPMGKRPLVPGEGGLADFCEKHEVVIELRFLRIRAQKK